MYTEKSIQTTILREIYIIGKNNILANAPLMYILYIFGCLRISIVLSKTLWVQFFPSLDLFFYSTKSPFDIKAMLKL